jgi:hypothetical protein
MSESLVSSLYLTGTSTESTTTAETLWNIQVEIPFFDFLTVAIIFLIAFFVFKLTFLDIWKD